MKSRTMAKLDYDDQDDQACPDTVPECAASEKALGQSREDGSPHAHYENEANSHIIIDETARPPQVILIEVYENEPAFWKVESTKDS